MDRRSLLFALGGGALASFIPWSSSASESRNLLGYIRTNWSRDPFSFGSYSYVAKGARRRDIRALEKPVDGRLFFAGEAVFPKHNSTVHAAYLSGQRTAQAVLKENVTNIAIVGAGMSGLSAAHKLANNRLKITVFEARVRIGGRIWTDKSLGLPLDLGASWIHGTKGNPLTKLANSVDQKYIKTRNDSIIRGRGGRIINERNVPDWLENVVSVQHNAGADYDQINKWAYLFQAGYSGPDVKFSGGYAKIFDALKGDYAVKLSTSVSKITLTERGVSLGLTSAPEQMVSEQQISAPTVSSQTFDAVIVTLPLGVLKNNTVDFDPPLPTDKQKAIKRLEMGTLDKVYLLFDQPFWDQSSSWILTPENDLPPGQFNQWLNLHPYLDKPIILAFNGGPPALDLANHSDKYVVKKALQTLDIAYPK